MKQDCPQRKPFMATILLYIAIIVVASFGTKILINIISDNFSHSNNSCVVVSEEYAYFLGEDVEKIETLLISEEDIYLYSTNEGNVPEKIIYKVDEDTEIIFLFKGVNENNRYIFEKSSR